MIRCPEGLAIDMRTLRFCAVLLLLATLFCACSRHRFAPDADGYGVTDTEADRHYVVLDDAYEAARFGEKLGEYVNKRADTTTVFYEIPGLGMQHFLVDGFKTVYCADEVLPDAASWTPEALLICEENAISVEFGRLTDATEIAPIVVAWFDGEQTELPAGEPCHARRLKLLGREYANLYYCVWFYVYEDGSAYLYNILEDRAVTLGSERAAKLLDAQGVTL